LGGWTRLCWYFGFSSCTLDGWWRNWRTYNLLCNATMTEQERKELNEAIEKLKEPHTLQLWVLLSSMALSLHVLFLPKDRSIFFWIIVVTAVTLWLWWVIRQIYRKFHKKA
jgi:hypothetical protein